MRRSNVLCALIAIGLGLCLTAPPSNAQQSTNFRLSDQAFNAGGNPSDGISPASASFRISLFSIGEPIAGIGLTSVSFHSDAGFSVPYPPPVEVQGVRFQDSDTLTWSGDRAASVFSLYRDLIDALPSLSYGTCLQPAIPLTTTYDTDLPATGSGFFYLVTAHNRLDEEGPKGSDSSGAARPNPDPCP